MSGKFKIVVSDLHLGAGPPVGSNPLEDFQADAEFSILVDHLVVESERSGADVELILNGDVFEMLQVPHVPVFDPGQFYASGRYHSSAEADSALKMGHIIAGHPIFFAALRRFLQVGPPRRSVAFVKGNHDLDLFWTAVQDGIRTALDGTGERAALLTFEAWRIVREGIYVEHGNQYAERIDRVRDMVDPRDPDRPEQLALPPGSRLVIDLFNPVERARYWIDGVKPITALVWYALKYDFPFAARALAMLLRALPGALGHAFLALDEPRAETLARKLEDPAQVEALAARYEEDPVFRAQFNAEVANLLSPAPALEGAGALDLAPTPDPETMGENIRRRMVSALHEAARRLAVEHGVRLVVMGHTHEPVEEALPGGARYVNSGTWTWRLNLSGASSDVWRELFAHPERFTDEKRLTYVRVDYDVGGQPTGHLVDHRPLFPMGGGGDGQTFWSRVLDWFRALWRRIWPGG
jgi:UDP-2,3-diacylglucosamine pyrophosphatase LpxH